MFTSIERLFSLQRRRCMRIHQCLCHVRCTSHVAVIDEMEFLCGNVRVLVVKRGEAFATRRAYAVQFEISHKYVYVSIEILMRVENT